MNRNKVFIEPITFKEFRKIKNNKGVKNVALVKEESDLSIGSIIKFWKDKKNIKNDVRRKKLTKELFIEYLEENYNFDTFLK